MKNKKIKFIIEEVRHIISSLTKVFVCAIKDESDEEISMRKSELSDQLKLFQTIPRQIEEVMDSGEYETDINQIKIKYENLRSNKDLYVTSLGEEVAKMEIEKKKISMHQISI